MLIGLPPRIGVIVPPANPTVELEMMLLLPPVVTRYTARLPAFPELPLRNRLEGYSSAVEGTASSLDGLRLEAIFVACTGLSYLVGPRADAELCARLESRLSCRVATAAQAILWALRTLGFERLAVVSPYEEWLADLSSRFWTEAGLEVRVLQLVRHAGEANPYAIDDRDLLDAVTQLPLEGVEAVLLTGTGMPTVRVIQTLRPELPIPLLSSNLCGASWLLTGT